MSMNTAEKKSVARQNAIATFLPILSDLEAVKFADNSFATLWEVDGEEFWVETKFVVKNNKPTKISPAFDPYEVAAAWEEEKKIKAGVKAQKAAEKAAKVAAAKEKKEEA